MIDPVVPSSLSAQSVRLYRGQAKQTAGHAQVKTPSWTDGDPIFENMRQAAQRWFTDSFEDAMWYVNDCPEGRGEMVALDLPASVAEQYRVSNIPLKEGGKSTPDNPAAFSLRPTKEFYLPLDLVQLALPVMDLKLESSLANIAQIERTLELVRAPEFSVS